MLISSAQVKHIAKLAQIAVKPKELLKFQSQLSNVLAFMSQIGELKTESVGETSQVTGITNRFREDKIDSSRIFTQQEALSQAKKTHRGYFVVKAIF